jgi:mRNA-degrading endonuclease RelE of RelBE toxin-antitoxin system
MRFVETTVFTRAVTALLDEEEYRALQLALALRPEQGNVIRGSGGLRKLRWGLAGRGKRGGARVIYYWDQPTQTFYMLYVYTKPEQGDLTPQQVKVLSRLVREEFK